MFALATAVALAGSPTPAFCSFDDDPMTAPAGASKGAQEAPPPATPKAKQPPRDGDSKTDDGGMLSGPKVPPDATGGNGTFGPGDGKGKGGPMRDRLMADGRLFMDALHSLHSELSDDQRTKIEEIRGAFEVRMKAWMDVNGEKLREYRQLYSGEGAGNGAGNGDMVAKKAALEEMQKLKASMPNMEETRDQLVAILTPDQVTTLKANMAQMRKDMEKRSGKMKGGPGKGPNGGKDGPDGQKAPPPQDPPKRDYKFPD